ncbi:MAG: PEP/pyruvate-binding domain-containing protein [Desulfobacterales bacterium]
MLIKRLDQISASDQKIAGGKSLALARLYQKGFPVPKAVCITTKAYDTFISSTGLRIRIQMEISRKDFSQMRWEEIWDAALRIRNFFLKKNMPPELNEQLRHTLEPLFKNSVVAVRSSAPGEDERGTSFAGLHESFVNIRGIDSVIDHVRLVWASLWSDAAMLYRKEIGLDVNQSKMAVIVQEMINGDRSGVIFTRNPANSNESVIESVHGLNQGLVDGIIEPDRWTLDMKTGKILSHVPAERKNWMIAGPTGVVVKDLPVRKSGIPPLDTDDVRTVFDQAMASENLFHYPQDMEWTFKGRHLYVLQSRPISTGLDGQKNDDRGWYLSLRRSLENLKKLRIRIEQNLVVRMVKEADALAGKEIDSLPDQELAEEIERRVRIFQNWKKIYWDDFIPFAHGMRMFGQFYSDTMRPEDPYEFVRLLETSDLQSIERNRQLAELAATVRHDPVLREKLKTGTLSEMDSGFIEKTKQFFQRYMETEFTNSNRSGTLPEMLVSIILEMSEADPKKKSSGKSREELEVEFLAGFDKDGRSHAEDLLDLARASYRLRDDDNMFLGRIEREMKRAAEAGKQRCGINAARLDSLEKIEAVARTLKDPGYQPDFKTAVSEKQYGPELQVRQLIGQPAGQGLGSGTARVIRSREDLGSFIHGEVMVCDAIDPNMTLVVPMAAAIVERRGGMLIHGAIIAREYGIPCVTGVPEATVAIHTGDTLTVDGFLGIVTVTKEK